MMLDATMQKKVDRAIKTNLGFQERMLEGIECCRYEIQLYNGPWTKEKVLELLNIATDKIYKLYKEVHEEYQKEGVK